MRLFLVLSALVMVSGCAYQQVADARNVADAAFVEYQKCLQANIKKPKKCEGERIQSESLWARYWTLETDLRNQTQQAFIQGQQPVIVQQRPQIVPQYYGGNETINCSTYDAGGGQINTNCRKSGGGFGYLGNPYR